MQWDKIQMEMQLVCSIYEKNGQATHKKSHLTIFYTLLRWFLISAHHFHL